MIAKLGRIHPLRIINVSEFWDGKIEGWRQLSVVATVNHRQQLRCSQKRHNYPSSGCWLKHLRPCFPFFGCREYERKKGVGFNNCCHWLCLQLVYHYLVLHLVTDINGLTQTHTGCTNFHQGCLNFSTNKDLCHHRTINPWQCNKVALRPSEQSVVRNCDCLFF